MVRQGKLAVAWFLAISCGGAAATAFGQGPKHVMFAYVDHFEPARDGESFVRMWVDDYIAMASKHVDADGRHPIHTYFLLSPAMSGTDIHWTLTTLNEVTYKGYGEVEYHLHHGIEDERLRTEAEAAAEVVFKTYLSKQDFTAHGAWVTAEVAPQCTFAFIHGMWALDNSRLNDWSNPSDPHRQYCGVNQELTLLKNLGTYADFTFMAWGPMSPLVADSIFYVRDDSEPASYKNPDNVRMVQVGQPPFGDLMIVEGPNTNADIGVCEQYNNPATLVRMDGWVGHNVCVLDQDDWVFVKVHTHGVNLDLTHQPTWDAQFGPVMDQFYADIEAKYNDGVNWKLHYVSSREMYNIIKAAEAGMVGDPGQHRDFLIKPYANMVILTENKYQLLTYAKEWVVLEITNTDVNLEFAMKEFRPCATIEESDNWRLWYDSDAVVDLGCYGELHFTDDTPSRYYRIANSLCPDILGDLDCDGDVDLDDFAILAEELVGPRPPGVYYEPDGVVVMEAEHYATKTGGSGPAAGSNWADLTGGGSRGEGYSQALPDNGLCIDFPGIESSSPQLSYEVHFSTAGLYYLWLKGAADNADADSVHYGLDGSALSSGSNDSAVLLQSGSFTWQSTRNDGARLAIAVPSAAAHTVDLWMREDGARIDRLLLTYDESYIPDDPQETLIRGDLDFDGDCDLEDYLIFTANFTGPG